MESYSGKCIHQPGTILYLNFPLKVVFGNVKGELWRPIEGFSKYVTFDCSESKELFLTQWFLSEMQEKCTTGDIDLKEMLKREQSNGSGYPVFLSYDSRFWEDKGKKDEQTFCAEERKEEENIIKKNFQKGLNWILKNGKESGKQIEKDFKHVIRSVREGKLFIRALSEAFKIKELGYKTEQRGEIITIFPKENTVHF